MPIRENGQELPANGPPVPSHVPVHPQTAAKARAFGLQRPRSISETDSALEGDRFEPSVPLLRKALLGVANRRRRHERRSHLQVQVRNGNACLEWLPISFPFVEGGTASSNPPSSTGESATNCSGVGLRWSAESGASPPTPSAGRAAIEFRPASRLPHARAMCGRVRLSFGERRFGHGTRRTQAGRHSRPDVAGYSPIPLSRGSSSTARSR
jgi:hypothetical protein